ncbi:hypothetical protein GT037_010820 [Alternaria burnsii]|uniref:Zn(2)-C6 fungal-type domain-containing protein n=1 Tax=Alternaria burnsii TaxID=1187904 RepID=A0A8H7EAS7_9PLEO|nr:uncharacterized protein GT037_010820 [Alternaria burnsii]KAF7671039.1 hypothetical protein GT037_010820 [Alternaria burnsii]
MFACARCHAKKIKCNGPPNCRNCVKAQSPCQPHIRFKAADAYKQNSRRLAWIEAELTTLFNVDCASIPTGTSLAPILEKVVRASAAGSQVVDDNDRAPESSYSRPTNIATPVLVSTDATDIGLLALNATGELRYLGPSSGSFFFNIATSLARISGPSSSLDPNEDGRDPPLVLPDRQEESQDLLRATLPPDTIKLLISSYKLWIQPLYPLLNDDDLNQIESGYSKQDASVLPHSPEVKHELISFYLVMNLGAINASNTVKQLRISLPPNHRVPSATSLYERAMALLEGSRSTFRPSLSLIRIVLLICITASYRATGYTQWQLTGLAMRMAIEIGLHSSHHKERITADQLDRKSRVFWTAYLIEISLAYSLGRPPSIGDTHISVGLPMCTEDLQFALHHLTHRRIQSKIISSVYATNATCLKSSEDTVKLISELQVELDEWKKQLEDLCESRTSLASPISYWTRLHGGTSSVLHRPSPLCPKPSVASAIHCISSAGAYIESLLHSLRSSQTPLTWMSVQGALLAGVTMVFVTRVYSAQIIEKAGTKFVLVDFPMWTRKCSMCMAIIEERWKDDQVANLDAHFETLANETVERIALAFTGANTKSTDELADGPDAEGSDLSQLQVTETPTILRPDSDTTMPQLPTNAVEDVFPWTRDTGTILAPSPNFSSMSFLDELSDLENGQAFWDMFLGQSGFDVLDTFGNNQS